MHSFTFPALWMPLGVQISPECFLPAPYLPLDLLRDLLNPKLVVLRQELQLLVNKPQPLLSLFPHFQAVNPERAHAGFKSGSPHRPAEKQGDAGKPACAPAAAPQSHAHARRHAFPPPRCQPRALRSATSEEALSGGLGQVLPIRRRNRSSASLVTGATLLNRFYSRQAKA